MRTLAIALLAAACTQVPTDFECAVDADCTTASGAAGRCEGTLRCSYADMSCSSGFRYGDFAGTTSNQCTSEEAFSSCVAEVRTGVAETCVRRDDGTVWCWGNGMNAATQIGLPAGTITQLDTSGAGLCARYADDKLHCVSGPKVGDISIPARGVAIGAKHVCAITTDGHVACWGDNARGELGDNTMTPRPTPANVSALSNVTKIASGLDTSCAITGGQVWCWGDDNRSQIGRGFTLDEYSLVPERSDGTTGYASIAVGDWFTCGVTSGGEVWCWGDNSVGQAGQGDTGGENDIPVRVASLSGIAEITAGGRHVCARATAGQVWCWGANAFHESAASAPAAITTPTQVVDANNAPVLFHDIAAGAQHTCGRAAADGSVLCWGDNAMGQIGDGTRNVATRPTAAATACN